jgi:type II secretory pathway component PulF
VFEAEMLFSSRISLRSLVALCQALRVGHGAGLSLVDVFRQQALRGPSDARPALRRISERLDKGDSLEDVLKTDGSAFPPLFVSMVAVGEQTGNLPDIFHELERYYREQLTLRRQFITGIIWPVFELVAGIAVVTLLILILGWIAPSEGKAFDPIGFGVGVPGAVRFLFIVALFFGSIFVIYFLATRALGQKATVHRFLLSVPGVGGCLQAIALARLSLAFRLTLDSTMPTGRAVKRSLLATGNGAYEACADTAAVAIKGGATVTDALTGCRIFPEHFLQAIHNGEESGQIPEVMSRQAAHYQEEASLKMSILNRLAGLGVLAFVMAIMIFLIFRIAFTILGVYDAAGSTDLSKPLY